VSGPYDSTAVERGSRPIATALAVALLTVAAAACDGDDAGPGRKRAAAPVKPPSTRVIPVGASPAGVAVGADGVWVANNAEATLTRIDGDTGKTLERAIRVGDGPTDVAADNNGVWVTTGRGIVRVDPSERRVVGEPVAVPDATGLAVGEAGVWVTSGANGTVSRIDRATGQVAGRPIRVGHRPTDVAVGAGAVWVANSGDGTVTRIDPHTRRAAGEPIAVAREQVLGLTVGAGRVWVAKTDSPLAEKIAVVAIDPGANAVEGEAVRVDAGIPVRLAAGEGAVWVTDVGRLTPPGRPRPASVVRIDPRARAVAGRPVRIGGSPVGIAAGAGAIWVTSARDGTVTRIDP
jgi:DNA-binding beta-propeller fold protein YncE